MKKEAKSSGKRKKKTSHSTASRTSHAPKDLSHTLAKNLVELQKINTDLAEKFDKLTKEISQLLALFEVTARNFAKQAPIGEYEKDKDFLNKIDRLLDQNKVLAKGLTMMEERLRERMYGPGHQEPRPTSGRPLPKF
jgi:chaperonin cofactor prefoldin